MSVEGVVYCQYVVVGSLNGKLMSYLFFPSFYFLFFGSSILGQETLALGSIV